MSAVIAPGVDRRSGIDEPWLGRDLAWLLVRLGSTVVDIEAITTLRSATTRPTTFRVLLADGRSVKARRLGSPFVARRFATLARELPADRFPRILATRRLATIEEWIPGQAVDRIATGTGATRTSRAATRWCGDVLGTLHTTAVGPEAEPFADRRGSEARMQALDAALAHLAAAGALTSAQVQRLSRRARAQLPPEHTAVGLVHADLAPENVIARPSGDGFVCIDNTTLAIDALDLDLARTWYRWPMSTRGRAAFLEAYEIHRSAQRFRDSLDFWLPVVLASAARFRVARATETAEVPLEGLRALARRPIRPSAVPSPGRLVFGWSGVTMGVSAPAPVLRWLDESYQPWFVPDRDGPSDLEVRVVIAEGSEAAPAAPERDPDGEADAFVLDTRIIRLPVWNGPDGSVIAFDPVQRVRYELSSSRSIVIRARDDGAGPRVAVMRVVREILTAAWRRAGGAVIHAAAVAIDGRVIVIGGPKGAGKTSLMVHALRIPGARFIANDRVGVRFVDGRLEGYGIPTIVSHRPGTLDAELREAAARARFSAVRTLAEAAAISRDAGSPDPSVELPSLSPAQLCRLLGVAPARGGPIGAVVIPVQEPDRSGIKLHELPAAEVGPSVVLLRFGRTGDPASGLFGAPPARPGTLAPAKVGDAISALAERVPWHQALLGPDAYQGDPWILRRLAG